jgi:hypothetical protein
MLVAGEDRVAIESQRTAGDSVIPQKSDHARDLDLEVHRPDPVLMGLFVLGPELAIVPPGLEIVVGKAAVFRGNHFRQFATEEAESTTRPDYVDGHVKPVQDQHTG